MRAPERFAAWLTAHEHKDPRYGWVYRYHPRSDAHSIALCTFVLADLIQACPALREQSLSDKVVYGINARHTFPNGKKKTLDLAIGSPKAIEAGGSRRRGDLHGRDRPRPRFVRGKDRDDRARQVATPHFRRTWLIARDRSPGRPGGDCRRHYRGEHRGHVRFPASPEGQATLRLEAQAAPRRRTQWSTIFAACPIRDSVRRHRVSTPTRRSLSTATIKGRQRFGRSTGAATRRPRPLRHLRQRLAAAYATRFG